MGLEHRILHVLTACRHVHFAPREVTALLEEAGQRVEEGSQVRRRDRLVRATHALDVATDVAQGMHGVHGSGEVSGLETGLEDVVGDAVPAELLVDAVLQRPHVQQRIGDANRRGVLATVELQRRAAVGTGEEVLQGAYDVAQTQPVTGLRHMKQGVPHRRTPDQRVHR
tara:strand:+ start:15644 stop:16150 length:507 start_codon:yes stop_codon:yes gene_type:complete